MSTQTLATPTQSQGLLRPDTDDTQESPTTPNSNSIDSLFNKPYPDYTDKDVVKAPWKYIGYRVFSKWIASDQSFFIIRRFGALQARVVLSLQDEIVRMEEELDSMDKAYSRRAVPDVVDNGSFRNDPWNNERGEVVKNIGEKLKYYSGFIFIKAVRSSLTNGKMNSSTNTLSSCPGRSFGQKMSIMYEIG